MIRWEKEMKFYKLIYIEGKIKNLSFPWSLVPKSWDNILLIDVFVFPLNMEIATKPLNPRYDDVFAKFFLPLTFTTSINFMIDPE